MPSASTARSSTADHAAAADNDRLAIAAGVFAMLADATRLHLLSILADGPADVSTLVERVAASRTSVSQHLSKLRLAGLVTFVRDGRRIEYSLPDGHMVRLVREALNHADHQITGEPHHG